MRRIFGAVVVLFLLAMSIPAMASVYDISVTADGDRMYYRQWYYGGNNTGWIVDANPNQVSHSYEPGWGDARATALSFDLTPLTAIPTEDILSASFNFKILDIWTNGRDDVGDLNGVGTVYASDGTGWKSFDITKSLTETLNKGGKTADYYFAYTGYSGFTFGSAEGGQPAYLTITTASVVNPVPVPAAVWLLGSGLLGLFGIRRKFRK